METGIERGIRKGKGRKRRGKGTIWGMIYLLGGKMGMWLGHGHDLKEREYFWGIFTYPLLCHVCHFTRQGMI